MKTPFFKNGILLAAVVLLTAVSDAAGCPFCTAESQTLSEETQSADAVVLAKLLKEAEPANESDDSFAAADADLGTATFQVVEVLEGQDLLVGVKEIRVVFFGEPDREQVFLVSGIGTDRIDWTTPLPLSPAAVDYVRKLKNVPPSGVERLAFFQEYLENDDPLLAQDAYDEFARAPYADVVALKPRMHHDQLVKWINDPEVSPSRRRLYVTMLGVCGTQSDLPMLESLIKSDFQAMKPHLEQVARSAMAVGAPLGLSTWIDLIEQDERRKKVGLDALVACYLTLRGADGLDLIDERFLKNHGTEYTYIYSTIMALRFHGEEPTSTVPRERLLASMRLLLDNPEFADQVIPDLARWEDWSVLDRLVEMFKSSDKNGYVRQPVVTYLTVASEQPGEVGTKAQAALTELEQLDPEGVRQARSLMAFGALSRARADSGGASTSNEAASAAATESPTTSNATDSPSEFTASTEEIQAAQQTRPSDFPNPADYAEPASPNVSVDNPAAEPEGQASKTATSAATLPTGPAAEAASPSADAAGAEAPSTGIAEPAGPELSRLLLVGVPLGAAVLLMGIYWMILRVGAV
jgi:hypothetical protein